MQNQKINFSSGQVSRTIIILAMVLLIGIVLVYFGIKYSTATKTNQNSTDNTATPEGPAQPVYETQIGDIKISFVSAINLGNTIYSAFGGDQSLTTTEKFIKVVITAQNKGKVKIDGGNWGMGDIIDSEERIFNAHNKARDFLERNDLCGEGLKPEFEPTRCVRVYEVSRESHDFKVEIMGAGANGKKEVQLLDVIVN